MSDLMKSVSGIRGVYGDTLTPQVALTIAANFGIFCGRGKIVVGRDSRTTGLAMFQAVTSGLISVGCDVVDLGIVPTPTTLITVKELQASGGIVITASHNPPEWNAMKLVSHNGMFLFPDVANEFLTIMGKPVRWADWQNMGTIYHDNSAGQRHIEKILSIPYLNTDEIRKQNYKVVIDSVNGAGGLISPLLLQELGCQVIELNSKANGVFSHPAEPLNKNLTELEQAVRKHGADIGFATDPDVDRLSVVSDQGLCLGEEYTVALAELFVLSKKKGDLVVNLSSSLLSEYVASQYDVKVHRTKIGEIHIGKKMLEIQSPIGGEGNGGVICPDVHYTRDALTGMALILGLMAERKNSISQIVEGLPKYYIHKDKIETVSSKIDVIMSKVPFYFEGLELDTQDGIKASGKNFWVHIRKSGTEPIIRIYVESDELAKSQEICQKTKAKLLAE
jgi:phosphomannomutase